MASAKSIVLERKGENDGFAQRFGQAIPNGSLVLLLLVLLQKQLLICSKEM